LKKIAPTNVHFLGIKKNVFPYLKKTDVFALPSLYEGMPRVLMEALACGCTCVVNDFKTGSRELLDVGLNEELKTFRKTKYGYLVPFNNKEEFVKALNAALTKSKKIKPDTRYDLKKITEMWRVEIDKFL
jgi:glycosyltransferase involved in cell wall biosynthesis